MKKIATVLFLFASIVANAQPPDMPPPGGGRPNRFPPKGGGANRPKPDLKALYVGFVTRELQLTEAESSQFWAIHNELDTEMKAFKDIKDELEKQQKMLDIKKKFSPRFIKLIGEERTNKFWKIQARFLQMLKQRQEGKPPTP